MIEGQSEKYAEYMDKAMQSLLEIVADPTKTAPDRIMAAKVMDSVNDTIMHMMTINGAVDKAVAEKNDLMKQVKRLKPKQPWEEDGDE